MIINTLIQSKHISEKECVELLKEKGVKIIYKPTAIVNCNHTVEHMNVLEACQKFGLLPHGNYLILENDNR